MQVQEFVKLDTWSTEALSTVQRLDEFATRVHVTVDRIRALGAANIRVQLSPSPNGFGASITGILK